MSPEATGLHLLLYSSPDSSGGLILSQPFSGLADTVANGLEFRLFPDLFIGLFHFLSAGKKSAVPDFGTEDWKGSLPS